MGVFTYEYTNGYINNTTEIRLIKIYDDGVYYFRDWVELNSLSSELEWEYRANQIMTQVQSTMNNNVPVQDQIADNQGGE